MTDKTTGVLLKGQDGHNYFIPHTRLEEHKADNVDENDITTRAPQVEAYAAEQDGPEAPVMAMMTS